MATCDAVLLHGREFFILPSFGRFKAVCQSWHSIIESEAMAWWWGGGVKFYPRLLDIGLLSRMPPVSLTERRQMVRCQAEAGIGPVQVMQPQYAAIHGPQPVLEYIFSLELKFQDHTTCSLSSLLGRGGSSYSAEAYRFLFPTQLPPATTAKSFDDLVSVGLFVTCEFQTLPLYLSQLDPWRGCRCYLIQELVASPVRHSKIRFPDTMLGAHRDCDERESHTGWGGHLEINWTTGEVRYRAFLRGSRPGTGASFDRYMDNDTLRSHFGRLFQYNRIPIELTKLRSCTTLTDRNQEVKSVFDGLPTKTTSVDCEVFQTAMELIGWDVNETQLRALSRGAACRWNSVCFVGELKRLLAVFSIPQVVSLACHADTAARLNRPTFILGVKVLLTVFPSCEVVDLLTTTGFSADLERPHFTDGLVKLSNCFDMHSLRMLAVWVLNYLHVPAFVDAVTELREYFSMDQILELHRIPMLCESVLLPQEGLTWCHFNLIKELPAALPGLMFLCTHFEPTTIITLCREDRWFPMHLIDMPALKALVELGQAVGERALPAVMKNKWSHEDNIFFSVVHNKIFDLKACVRVLIRSRMWWTEVRQASAADFALGLVA